VGLPPGFQARPNHTQRFGYLLGAFQSTEPPGHVTDRSTHGIPPFRAFPSERSSTRFPRPIPSYRSSHHPPPEIQVTRRGSRVLLPAGVRHPPTDCYTSRGPLLSWASAPLECSPFRKRIPQDQPSWPWTVRQPKLATGRDLQGVTQSEDRIASREDSYSSGVIDLFRELSNEKKSGSWIMNFP